MLFTLDPTTKTSIQQEERCLGPTHFHHKRHKEGFILLACTPARCKHRSGKCAQHPPTALGLPRSLTPGCPAAQWPTQSLLPQGYPAVTVVSSTAPRKQCCIPALRGEASVPQEHFCSFLKAWGVWHTCPERPLALTACARVTKMNLWLLVNCWQWYTCGRE